MAEYINRTALGIGYADPKVFINPAHADGWNTAIQIINEAPTADVAPVVHGHWIKTSLKFASSNGKHGNVHVCANCGEQSGVGFKTPYCAICGAKMDEEG